MVGPTKSALKRLKLGAVTPDATSNLSVSSASVFHCRFLGIFSSSLAHAAMKIQPLYLVCVFMFSRERWKNNGSIFKITDFNPRYETAHDKNNKAGFLARYYPPCPYNLAQENKYYASKQGVVHEKKRYSPTSNMRGKL